MFAAVLALAVAVPVPVTAAPFDGLGEFNGSYCGGYPGVVDHLVITVSGCPTRRSRVEGKLKGLLPYPLSSNGGTGGRGGREVVMVMSGQYTGWNAAVLVTGGHGRAAAGGPPHAQPRHNPPTSKGPSRHSALTGCARTHARGLWCANTIMHTITSHSNPISTINRALAVPQTHELCWPPATTQYNQK